MGNLTLAAKQLSIVSIVGYVSSLSVGWKPELYKTVTFQESNSNVADLHALNACGSATFLCLCQA